MVQLCQRVVDSKAFQRFITAAILFAGLLVGLETSPTIMAGYGGLIGALDGVVLTIFTLEVVVRMTAEAPRPWRYFRDPWNCFDFIIVAGALLPFVANYVTVLRLFRLLRVLRLVRTVPRLQVLVATLLHSLPSMGYVVLLLGLLFYIYGVAGVFFFAAAAPDQFGDLASSLITLFQVMTLEDWVDIFHAIREHLPEGLVALYFISFILIGTMVMLNLIIGVVLEGMKEARHRFAPPPALRAPPDAVADEVEALRRDLALITDRAAALAHRLGAAPPRAPTPPQPTEEPP